MVLKKILCSCKKATYLIEKRQLENITLMESCGLELHLKGCAMCKTYMRQSILINGWIRKVFVINESDLLLEAEFKEEMQQRINALIDKKISRHFFNPNSSEYLKGTRKPKRKKPACLS